MPVRFPRDVKFKTDSFAFESQLCFPSLSWELSEQFWTLYTFYHHLYALVHKIWFLLVENRYTKIMGKSSRGTATNEHSITKDACDILGSAPFAQNSINFEIIPNDWSCRLNDFIFSFGVLNLVNNFHTHHEQNCWFISAAAAVNWDNWFGKKSVYIYKNNNLISSSFRRAVESGIWWWVDPCSNLQCRFISIEL